ncbi:MAG: acetyl-CoA carboxylase biotin carboxyl carrier protein [Fusobacteriaceae bacterium]|nr:acetyl-CoA carboxylase biotin carboxyl carrier protein [Fusobacteriaceae bacterium]
MKLDLESIKNLAENIEKYKLSEVLVESNGIKVTLKKERPKQNINIISESAILDATSPEKSITDENKIKESTEKEYETIISPMVGTFYKSPIPGNPPFVVEDQEVNKGDTLCILEAMKLMNEVKAPKNCRIIKILVEDGQIVRKGDKLFAIK